MCLGRAGGIFDLNWGYRGVGLVSVKRVVAAGLMVAGVDFGRCSEIYWDAAAELSLNDVPVGGCRIPEESPD